MNLRMTADHVDAVVKTSQFGSHENLALFLHIEYPHLLKAPAAKVEAVTGIPRKVVDALRLSPAYRQAEDRLLTFKKLDYKTREKLIDKLIEAASNPENGSFIKSQEILARQGLFKVPERTQHDEHRNVEITVRHLPSEEAGVSDIPQYQLPVSRRRRLGERVDSGQAEDGVEAKTITLDTTKPVGLADNKIGED